jgi:hypothetical protein
MSDATNPPNRRGTGPVNLQVVTSCLSPRQPYTLPFEGELFAFKADELALLLPEPVMKQLDPARRRDSRLLQAAGGVSLPARGAAASRDPCRRG